MPEKRIYAARREMPVAFQKNYFNNGSAYFADIDAAGMPAPGKTATARYTDERYIKTFMRTGNKKLTDVYDAETRERIAAYAQFNLPARDFKKIKQIRAEFTNVNIYFAIDGAKLDGIQYDNKCTCENCAKCAHCTFTEGKTTAVAIH